MADDPFDFLSPDGPEAEVSPVNPEAPAATPPAPENPEAPVAAETPPAAEVPPVVPPEVPPAQPVIAPGHVPLAAVLDEREKRQAAERELAELRRQAAPVKQPTVTDDPEGWQRAQDARFDEFRMAQKMEMSGRYAAQHFGQDKLQAAMDWGKQQGTSDPFFGQRFQTQEDPFGWLVEEHRRAQTLGLLGAKTPEEWALEYAASQGMVKAPSGEQPQATQQPAAAPAPVPPAPAPAPPKSIAGATPAGGSNTPVTLQEQEVGAFWSK